jgi:hypothetical protein
MVRRRLPSGARARSGLPDATDGAEAVDGASASGAGAVT